MANAWMIRAGRSGKYASLWLCEGVVQIFWDLNISDIDGLTRDEIRSAYEAAYPDDTSRVVGANCGQVYRFASEIVPGCTVVMYDPETRLYHLGTVTSPCRFAEVGGEAGYVRDVKWISEKSRDDISQAARNSLGSISTVFSVNENTLEELTSEVVDTGKTGEDEEAEDGSVVRYATVEDGIERIKDRIAALGWEDMEDLTAGLLRAMGYKTSMTAKGGDGGRDAIASPDGLGLAMPRVITEVKHHKQPIGADKIRSFLGGLRPNDSGLYVSTGGFTREARYEADRANVPIRLLDLDAFARLYVSNYEQTDLETRALLPLVRIYWPA